MMDIEYTSRGFAIVKFSDIYNQICSVQDSSLAEKSAIWLGGMNDRAHLDQDIVAELIPILQRFVDTGSIAE